MKRWLVALASVAAVGVMLGATGVLSLLRAEHRRIARSRHAARGETELKILNPAGASLALFRAGVDLDGATALPVGVGETWLAEGRYFVEATKGTRRLLLPVTADGTGEGPEPDGSWTATVREPASERPSVLDERGLGFVFVPGGWFTLGERQNPGQPHAVWVPSFYLAAFEVTNREFRRFLADPGGYDDRTSWTAAGWSWRAGGHSQATARLAPSDERYPRFGRDELPVMLVTWYEASAYCRWLDPPARRRTVALPDAHRGRVGEGGTGS